MHYDDYDAFLTALQDSLRQTLVDRPNAIHVVLEDEGGYLLLGHGPIDVVEDLTEEALTAANWKLGRDEFNGGWLELEPHGDRRHRRRSRARRPRGDAGGGARHGDLAGAVRAVTDGIPAEDRK